MSEVIVKLKDGRYFLWSTETDEPVWRPLNKMQTRALLLLRHLHGAVQSIEFALQRADRDGTSSRFGRATPDSVVFQSRKTIGVEGIDAVVSWADEEYADSSSGSDEDLQMEMAAWLYRKALKTLKRDRLV